jgi:transposase
VDALGNPLKMVLTGGQVHDLAGADALLPKMEAAALLADKAYDADRRMIEPLQAAGKTALIPCCTTLEMSPFPTLEKSPVCAGHRMGTWDGRHTIDERVGARTRLRYQANCLGTVQPGHWG